jgi:predicted heme/steroid binding protein
VAEAFVPLTRGVAPARIWMVDSGRGFELYSNGLRIDTSFAVAGDPRRYRVFEAARGMGAEVHDRPVGIVYHTSESDIWPLEETFNEKLRDSSQNLLRYLKKNHVYHYLIDRFGQVFRVVEETDKANHSGMSVWSAGNRVYLNLNGPTLGVSFETRWEGGRALPITRAQFEAGRSLTDYLRHKWSIEAEMCVTHGLTSVNSKKHLIGHHVDWARGFPFEAFGLPDQYRRASPAVALFGFGYDERFLAVMGEPWPGVAEAERQLQADAAAAGRATDDLRRERARTYDLWLDEQQRDAEMAERAAAPRATRAASGG